MSQPCAAYWWVVAAEQIVEAIMYLSHITMNDMQVHICASMVGTMPITRLVHYREKKARPSAVQLQVSRTYQRASLNHL